MEATYKLYKIDIKEIGSIDLQEEITANPEVTDWEAFVFVLFDKNGYEETARRGTVLYSPTIGRAGIEWGAGASWTDCVDEDDAMERYFEKNGKEMRN